MITVMKQIRHTDPGDLLMNKLVRGAILAAIATVVALMTAVPALAAPVPLKGVDVTVHYEQNTPVVLVTGYLPDSAKLPAAVELAVPAGGQFSWAGEILGGDPSADPSVQYTVRQDKGMDVYSFTLTKARTGQVEVSLPSAISFDGTTYRAAVKWTAVTDIPDVNLFVRVPNGTQVTEPAEGAEMTAGPQGFSYYKRAIKGVKAGTPVDLTFAYTAPAQAAGGAVAGAPAGASQPSNNALPLALIIVLVGGALALLFMGLKGKMAEKHVEAAPAPAKKRATQAAAASDDDESFAIDPSDEDEEADDGGSVAAPQASAPARPASKSPIIIGLVVIGIAVAGFAAAGSGTAAQTVGGTVVKDFGNPSACSSTQAALTTDDPEKVFAALQGVDGLGKVTVDPATKSANVEFCVSSTSEQVVFGALSAAGILGQAAPAAAAPPTATAPATPAP